MDDETPYPILPYCLYHATPLTPGERNGVMVLSCLGCSFDELMGDIPRKTIEIPVVTADEWVRYGRIYDGMMAAKLPNVGKFHNEDLGQ